MGKERVEKKEKKEKKEKRSDDGVKKAKKEKKVKVDETVVAALEEQLEASGAPVAEAKVVVAEQDGELVVKPVGALVPFAAPLADDKVAKKVLKSVKKGTFDQLLPAVGQLAKYAGRNLGSTIANLNHSC